MAAKMATIVGDVIGLQERHHLLMIYLILLRRSKAFHCCEILQHIKNSRGGLHLPPPPHLYFCGSVNLSVRPYQGVYMETAMNYLPYVRGLITIKYKDCHVGFCILPLSRLRHYLSVDVCIPYNYFSYNLKNEIYYLIISKSF